MPVSKYKTWLQNEVLTSADLNASFDQIFDNQQGLGFPREASTDFNGFELILDADGDSSITVDTDDKLDIRLQGQDLFDFDGTTATSVNGLTFISAATANKPSIRAKGSDANISLGIYAKGTTGTIGLNVGTYDVVGVLTSGATPVNGVNVTGAVSGGTPIIAAKGDDTDVQLTLASKGVDPIVLRVGSIDVVTGIVSGTAVNGLTAVAVATGNPPELRATGADTNIGLKLVSKGTGTVQVNSSTITATPGNAAIPIANALGNLANGWISEASVTQHAAALAALMDLRLLNTFSLAGASECDINSTYVTYPLLIIWELVFSSDGAILNMRTSSNNGVGVDSGGTDYAHAGHGTNTAGSLLGSSSGSAQIPLVDTAGVGNAAPEFCTGKLWVNHPGGGGLWSNFRFESTYLDPSTRCSDYHGSAHRRSTTAINFIRLFPSAGTISGQVHVYSLALS